MSWGHTRQVYKPERPYHPTQGGRLIQRAPQITTHTPDSHTTHRHTNGPYSESTFPSGVSTRLWMNKNWLFLTDSTFLPARCFGAWEISSCLQWLFDNTAMSTWSVNLHLIRMYVFTTYCMISNIHMCNIHFHLTYTEGPHLSNRILISGLEGWGKYMYIKRQVNIADLSWTSW